MHLERNLRWFLALDSSGGLSQYGQALLDKLAEIYNNFDHTRTTEGSEESLSKATSESPVASTSGAQVMDPEPETNVTDPAVDTTSEIPQPGRGGRGRGRGRDGRGRGGRGRGRPRGRRGRRHAAT